ncbi:MAG: D-alanyl-D-alanine carboxypeptidase [bacterium]|nr:D-alanyl-D-alanine carboxypeptidase [bacterium]
MLTSLLSIYIASILQTDLNSTIQVETDKSLIKTASLSFEQIMESQKVPVKDEYFISPLIEAKGVISIDTKTGETLFEKNANERMPIASITKLMTVLIILEENKLDEIVIVSHNAASTSGSSMHLKAGEEITIENLIYGALINSANDSAVALAEHNAESVQKFVEKMNKRALELSLINTNFSNPVGLDGPDNYSSAYDIAKLGNYVYQNKFVQTVVNTKEINVSSVDRAITHKLKSTNDLLGNYLGVKGLKTGKTDGAGLCLVAIAENEDGNEIITVVLNSPARFLETKILIDWVFRAYNWP